MPITAIIETPPHSPNRFKRPPFLKLPQFPVLNYLFAAGLPLYGLSVIAIGFETLMCAHMSDASLGPQVRVIPVIPWLPTTPWLAYLFGACWIVFGAGVMMNDVRRHSVSALTFGGLFLLCALLFDAPRYGENLGNIRIRTEVFESIAIGGLSWLVSNSIGIPAPAVVAARLLFALSLVVFGVDHFHAYHGIANVMPHHIPEVLRSALAILFGINFVVCGSAIAIGYATRRAAISVGLMLALFVVAFHLPRIAGLYGVPNAFHSPVEWQGLFIALALCGGSWAYAKR